MYACLLTVARVCSLCMHALQAPVVLTRDRGGTTVSGLCDQIHRTLAKEFKYALVWGTSSKHYPQRCGLTHQLEDEDVVQVGWFGGWWLVVGVPT
jgi:ribosome-interacting GTPase 1